MAAKTKAWIIGLALIAGVPAATAFGQAPDAPAGGPGGGGPGGGGPGGRGNFDPAQFQQRRLEQIKTALGATDEEFQALQPKIEAVTTLQRQANAGMGGGGRGPGGGGGGPGGGGGGGGTPSAVQTAMQSLRETLSNNEAKPEEIKAKVEAVRAARAKVRQDLAKAQEDLKSLLTQRQEAALLTLGVLE